MFVVLKFGRRVVSCELGGLQIANETYWGVRCPVCEVLTNRDKTHS